MPLIQKSKKFLSLKTNKSKNLLYPAASIIAICLVILVIFVQKIYPSGQQFLKLPDKIEKEDILISPGDNLHNIFTQYNFNYTQIKELVKISEPHIDLTKLKLGQRWGIYSTNEGEQKTFKSLHIYLTPENRLVLSKSRDGNFAIEQISVPLKRDYAVYSGVIESSLLESARANNIPYSNIVEAINAHSYDIDFQRDIKRGNKYQIIIEKLIDPEDGALYHGKTIFSSLTTRDRTYNIYLFKMADGNYEFINEDYTTVKRSLLKTPVQATRISSKFGMRKHPVLGYSRMHRGIDFAAPPGTPIYAAGSGKIRTIGRKGGYGRYIQIRHNSRMSTAYGHLLAYAKGLKKGQYVKQGQIIGKVGTSGRATGPHLHYEVLINGKQVNPLSVKTEPTKKLKEEEKIKFDQLKLYVNKLTNADSKAYFASNKEIAKFYES